MGYKLFNLEIAASGATTTNKVYIGHHSEIKLYLSAITGFNAGAGNTGISIRGWHSSGTTHVALTSMTVTTETIQNVYHFDRTATPFISIGFGTATTGSASQVVAQVVTYDNIGSN